MKIAVDFDGTIVEHRFPEIGEPQPFAFEALRALTEEGHQIVLWTNREGGYLQAALEFCRKRGLEFYAVNSDFPNASWTGSGVSRKISADVYIDDKNFGGLPDWSEIYSTLSEDNGSIGKISTRRKKKNHSKKHKEKHSKQRHGLFYFLRKLSERCKDAKRNFRL